MHSSKYDDDTYDKFDSDSNSEEGSAESTFENGLIERQNINASCIQTCSKKSIKKSAGNNVNKCEISNVCFVCCLPLN